MLSILFFISQGVYSLFVSFPPRLYTFPGPPSLALSAFLPMAISLLYAPLLETIIFALIERACFKRNKKVYARGEDSLLVVGTNVHSEHLQLSFLEFFLLETVGA